MNTTSKPPARVALVKRCKYCRISFIPETKHGGSPQLFCTPAHRKAFNKHGARTSDKLMDQLRREMRQMIRDALPAILREILNNEEPAKGLTKTATGD